MKKLISRAAVLAVALVFSVTILPSRIGSLSNICTPYGLLSANFSALPSAEAADLASGLPNTFFFTHYEFVGDMKNPEGVKYLPNGQPSARAADGSVVIMNGQGGWDPAAKRAVGGGQYVVKDAGGAVKAQGTWQVTQFISFEQLPLQDWWGIPGFREEGWQGGPGSVSFSGFLTVNVSLNGLGNGVMRAWCLMPASAMADTHVGDGISLIGDDFNFGGAEQAELTMFENMEGVMFYSTDPTVQGWVLNPAGIAVAKDEGLRGFKAPASPDNWNPK